MKLGNFFGYSPNGIKIPKKLMLAYLVIFGVLTLLLLLLGRNVAALLMLCIGLCVFVLTDVMIEQRYSNRSNSTFFHRAHGAITCCLTGAAIVFCLYKLISYL